MYIKLILLYSCIQNHAYEVDLITRPHLETYMKILLYSSIQNYAFDVDPLKQPHLET